MIRFMPQRDPLEELFRRSADGMEQRPGLRGWHRLDQRLDQRRHARRRRTRGWFTAWHYAAATVALLLMIGLGLSRLSTQSNSVLARAPESLEELAPISPTQRPTLPADYASVPEGDRHAVLTVRNSGIPRIVPAAGYRL